MKPVKINGFTIVETMLFFAITGLLIMGILVGTGSSINIQRYRDSVTSLQSFLQLQYSNVANVSNDSLTNNCDGVSNRGQSGCVILGKYITIINGKTIETKDVLGNDTSSSTDASDDLSSLKNAAITTSNVGTETYDLEWGSSVAYKTSDNQPYILILRSPSSGTIRTFISKTTPLNGDIELILEDREALNQEAQLCVNSNGLFTGNTMAVKIDKNATSASGVETLGDNNNGC